MNNVIGMSKYGTPITLELEKGETWRILIAGNSGSGKSSWGATIITTYCRLLRENLDLRIIDPKSISLLPFMLRTKPGYYANEPAKALDQLAELNTIMDQRYIAMQKMGKVKLDNTDWERFPHILMWIEEYNTLVNNPDLSKQQIQQIKNYLDIISVRARSANISLGITLQQATTQDISSLCRNQANFRILCSMSSATDCAMIAPDPETAPAHLALKKPGEAFVIKNNEQPILSKTWYMNEEKLTSILGHYENDIRNDKEGWIVNNPYEEG